MENIAELEKSLPNVNNNRDSPTQPLYQRGSGVRGGSRSRGHTSGSNSRGGFVNQRGPGRGRSRSRGGSQENAQNVGGSWSSSYQGRGRGSYTFNESNINVTSVSPSVMQSKENELKHIVNRDSESPRSKKNYSNKPKIKNTIDFTPNHIPAEMRVLPAPAGLTKYHREITSRDVIIVSDLFCKPDDKTIYNELLKECESDKNHEWKLWHGDNHLIANDRTRRNRSYPMFDKVINAMKTYFDMDVQATRFNWFRDTKEWKPYHHDAAAVKPEKAAVQNITVAVSFGTEREIAFQHAKSGSTVSFPLPNGTLYTFSNDVNVIWRHGVPQVPPEKQVDEGRISIVAWGWVNGVINVGVPPKG